MSDKVMSKELELPMIDFLKKMTQAIQELSLEHQVPEDCAKKIIEFDDDGRIVIRQDGASTLGLCEMMERCYENGNSLEFFTGSKGWVLKIVPSINASTPNKACPLGGGCILPPKGNGLCACQPQQ